MKNVVFIPNIDLGNERSTPYHYSIKSWKYWCDKNNAILFEWKDPVLDVEQFKITLQRYWVHDILLKEKIDYDQVLIVDADTIIHPNCPNFFNETNGDFSVVKNNGCHEWMLRSSYGWGERMFPKEEKVKPWEYFNGGFQITNKSHIDFYKYENQFLSCS